MPFVVRIGLGDAGEQVLVALAREQVTVAQRVLAELGQQRIAASSVLTSKGAWTAFDLVALAVTSSSVVVEPVEKSIALPRPSSALSRTVCS